MTHPVMWFEVMGTDGAKLREFYGSLFGWTFRPIPDMDYGVVAAPDGRGIMGGVGAAAPGTAGYVTFYAETPDVAASLAKAEALGGRVVMPRTVLPSVVIGMFADPEGHVIGLSEATSPAAQ